MATPQQRPDPNRGIETSRRPAEIREMQRREVRTSGNSAGWFAWWWVWLVVILCAIWFAGWGWGGYGGWWRGNRGGGYGYSAGTSGQAVAHPK